MKDNYLYMKIDRHSIVNNKKVLLKDIVKLYSSNKKIVNNLNNVVILSIKEDKEATYVLSILKIYEIISKRYPDLEIINEGETDFIIHYKPPKKINKAFEIIKTIFVCFIVGIGSTFAIMTFNSDASVMDIFNSIYKTFMGVEKEGGTILEISYAIGLPLGIILFYNHFVKFRLGIDPTPMQIQMRQFESDVDEAIIENSNREGKTIDVN